MPTPVGHAFGGLATAWILDLVSRRRPAPKAECAGSSADRIGARVALACVVLAVLPDADLLFGIHRTATHSFSAALLVTIIATVVTGRVTPGGAPLRAGLMCGAAYASHLLLDWMAVDRNPPSGMQLLWPFSCEWFISGLDLFPPTQRSRIWSAAAMRTNLNAVGWETAILLPVLLLLWAARQSRRWSPHG